MAIEHVPTNGDHSIHKPRCRSAIDRHCFTSYAALDACGPVPEKCITGTKKVVVTRRMNEPHVSLLHFPPNGNGKAAYHIGVDNLRHFLVQNSGDPLGRTPIP